MKCTLVKRGLTAILAFLISAQSFGQWNTPHSRPLEAKELKDFLLESVPSFGGARDFFEKALKDQKRKSEYNALISSDSKMSVVAEYGQVFRENYRASLKSAFGEENFAFFVEPENTVLRWLFEMPEGQAAMRARLLPEPKASQLAFQETLARYGLPDELSLSDLESQRFSIPTLNDAFEFFRTRYFALTEQDEYVPQHDQIQMQEVKSRLRRRLLQLRADNAMAAFKAIPNKKMYFNKDGKITWENTDELAISTVDFIESKDQAGNSIVEKPKMGGLTDTYYYLKYRFRSRRPVMNHLRHVDVIEPLLPTYLARITLPTSEARTFSEKHFSWFLQKLIPPTQQFSKQQHWKNRFTLEAARRDAMITDILSFIEEYPDRNIESLQARTLGRMKLYDYGFKCVSCSLTEAARALNQVNLRDSQLENIRWFGFMINAKFWEARDLAANDLGLSKFDNRFANQKSEKSDAVKEAEAIANDPAKIRQSRLSAAIRRALMIGTLTFAVLGTGAVYLIVNYGEAMAWKADRFGSNLKRSIEEAMSSDEEKPKSEEEKKEEEKKKAEEEKAKKKSEEEKKRSPMPPKSVQPQDSPKASNVSKDAQDKAEKVILYQISELAIAEWELPRYFNLPQRDDFFPHSRFRNSTNYEVFQPLSLTKEKADFAVRTALPHELYSGGVQIVHPSGFKLVDLELQMGRKKLKLGDDYIIKVDRSTGLIHAAIKFDFDGTEKFNYVARFKKDTQVQRVNEASRLNKTTLQNVTNELRQSGGIELADSLERVIQNQKTISMDDVAEIFASSGVYTYDGENPEAKEVGRFGKYSKFIRDGVFWYQCTGSNLLLRDFLTAYLTDSRDRYTEVIPVTGFVRRNGELYVGSLGHLHNIVTRLDQPYTYHELDGTPARMDPKYRGHPFDRGLTEKEKKEKEEKERRQREEFLRNSGKQATLPNRLELKEGQGVEQKTIKTKPVGPAPEVDIAKRITEIELGRARLLRALQRLSQTYSSLASPVAAAKMPGVRLMALSRIIQEYAAGTTNLERTLRNLVALSLNLSPFGQIMANELPLIEANLKAAKESIASNESSALLAKFMEQEFQSFESQVRSEDELAKKFPFKVTPNGFLRDSELRLAARGLIGTLTTTNWKPLSLKAASCTSLVK